ncbi:GNAT family N-acetyltransferase [Yoonia litorea]|uniref:Acetyltransferase (GNAT) family protein n=1 Tax=Yoonia litorea TaxID=1123755 RepID=A0A1I6L268_9RHOB|nr:GNAT family N-acetyltransferase [Yoonia litorea]SFR97555.1 Acetyltransferase (GNAT) family protein [Yoonia litorea]
MKITVGIPDKDREAAARLYWDAFGEKLGFALGPKHLALQFVTAVMRQDHGVCAHDDDGRLIGVAGFKTSKGALVGGAFHDLKQIYGWASAAFRTSLLAALENDIENERFLMDGLFVAEDARGQGVGTALLNAITQEAKRRGYHQVRLDVVDTNTRAKSLYLRQGFRDVKTQRIGLLRFIFGFKSTTAMVRDIYPEPEQKPRNRSGGQRAR